MKRRLFLILSVLCMSLLLGGCQKSKEIGKKQGESNQEGLTSIKYSNIQDKSVQNELEKIMDEASISEQRQNNFFKYVDKFNNAVSEEYLAKEYEEVEKPFCKYDAYAMQEEWEKKYPNFMGYNCRITAYSLLGDFINISGESEIREDMLTMDMSALKEDNAAINSNEDISKFKILFSTIPTKNTQSIKEHVKNVKKDWKERGISFDESKTSAKLITVWFHESNGNDDNYVFVGHTGILFTYKNKLYFVEKIAFQEPYQLTVFNNRTELNDYLMIKYDINEGQDTARPFIMENGELMKGYRKVESNNKDKSDDADELKDKTNLNEEEIINEDADKDKKISEVKGTIEEIKDFMFIVTEGDTSYPFSFDKKPQGLENLKVGDKVIVKYTGTVSEVDPFDGEIVSVEKQ